MSNFAAGLSSALPAPWRTAIGLRLLGRVLLFSSAVTLTLTALQLYLDYRQGVNMIERRLDEIEISYVGSLGESLWHLDETQLALQLQGILRLPDIQAVEVHEAPGPVNPLSVALGTRASTPGPVREVPLSYAILGGERIIGSLRIEASLNEVYRGLITKALVILAGQGAKTFLVSLFILFIVHRLITRHLTSLAAFADDYDLRNPAPPRWLQRKHSGRDDELDRLENAFSRMCASLQRAYGELREANEELEEDIAERRRMEQALRESEQRFQDYTATASDWFWEMGPDFRFTFISERIRAFGLEPEDGLGQRPHDLAAYAVEPERLQRHIAALERHEPFRDFEYATIDQHHRRRVFNVSGQPVFDAGGSFLGYRGTASDRTEQREMEDRLRQSQKMEALGQLTGGIAHDFNNLLTVIIGNAEALAADAGIGDVNLRCMEMIREASARGAALTHRLLAFSRRQTLQPLLVDINAMLAGMEALLRRSLGEAIEMEWVRSAGLWRTFIDPHQLENALLNLAINARDAMPEGGRLTFETGNAHLDADYAATRSEVRPGQYVMVAVTDTGGGIPPEVIAHVFEPFFTTKPPGKGTGLGLSMVYGFIKQSGGHIGIYSEVGHGTTVRLYLPRARGGEQQATILPTGKTAPTGSESILVVEDEDLVRAYVSGQLASLGYSVIEAADGPSAIAVLRGDAEIHLLLTDIVMPGGMNGRQLAEAAKRLRPAIKVLYTSGYTENAVVHHGRLDPGIHLLSKPYHPADLARAVRSVIDGA